MKRIYLTALMFLSCIVLAACGGPKDGQDGGESSGQIMQTGKDDQPVAAGLTEYYDINVVSEPVFQWDQNGEDSPTAIQRAEFIGMQFYKGEPVQLWQIPHTISWDLYLYRPDGSREVVLKGVDVSNSYQGYLDQEGSLYWWHNPYVLIFPDGGQEKRDGALIKYLASGEVLFEKKVVSEEEILDMCQAEDGRLYLTVRDTESKWLAEMDPDTGLITKLCNGLPVGKARDGSFELGVNGDKPAAWIGRKIAEIDTDSGAESDILSLQGTSYITPEKYRICQDFRILEDGSAEVLWSVSNGSGSLRERLRLAKVDKTPIIVRTWTTGSWFLKKVGSFNQGSEKYHVIVENQADDREDFARLTSVQIATGKGPDILMGDLMQEYIFGMIEKGALEDLAPYMERSGIREEDYFPYVFDAWRDGDRIFGISPALPILTGYLLDGDVLGKMEEPDIGTLVDVLLARQEDALFLKGYDSQALLGLLLNGTETLWGMVDWEKGSCNFEDEMFAGILETAKRYGDNGGSEGGTYIAQVRNLMDIFHMDSRADRERDGKVIGGVLFDDGCHVVAESLFTLAVNANSANKEGAWEFLSFLLGDAAQSDGVEVSRASKRAFDIWVEQQKEQVADGREIHELRSDGTRLPDGSMNIVDHLIFSEKDITEERIAEYKEMLEDARTYPLRTVPILDIIGEEAANYFNGSKSAAEVGKVVANRVQTYLDEGR